MLLKPDLMANTTNPGSLSDKGILNKIFSVRGYKVMLDFDLSSLYAVETSQLKRQVRRNLDRFPEDFMFELTAEEYDSLRCQLGILKRGEHSKYAPMAFTEQGVAMLSSVLNSPTAIKVNIQIIRVFTKMREEIFAALKKLFNPPAKPRPRIGFRRKDEKD